MNIPRVNIAHLPTPIEPMPRLSATLGGPMISIKRDDCTGLAFGGNKTRKLEFVLAEAQANGARTLITSGALQSNHCRQTAALAAKYGFKCILVLYGEEDSLSSGNLYLDQLFGAEIVLTTSEKREETTKRVFDEEWGSGQRPFLIPVGASTPIGAVAYFYAFKEFLEQGLDISWIIIPTSSGGTQAGLTLGAKKFGWKGNVLGINVGSLEIDLNQTVCKLASEAAERLMEKITISAEDVHINNDYCGSGYGILGEMEKEAIHLFAQNEGLLIDPVYTGRAAAAMIDLIRNGFFSKEQRLLFWHTGGTPALFAHQYTSLLR